MNFALANAAPPPDPNAMIVFAYLCLLLMGAAFVLALAPLLLARHGPDRRKHNLLALVVVWALFTWGTSMHVLWRHDQWTQTYNQRLLSGQYDAADPYTTADAPKQPWILWAISAAGYAALVAWSIWPAAGQSASTRNTR